MENNLIEIFGLIVKASRDTGLDIVSEYKNNKFPKAPDEEQKALMELIKTLDDKQLQQLEKGMKYCIELSLFKLIDTVENGVSKYSFDLAIKDGKDSVQLVGDETDNELTTEYWSWVGEV